MNMSHCRHANTSNDLQQVIDNWDDYDEECLEMIEDGDEPCPDEAAARLRIIQQCRELLEIVE